MILVGNARGNGQELAAHLMSPENEHVTVHEISGFAGDDLSDALKEAEAIARGTKCQKYLYSLSLNPPAQEHVGTPVFEAAIEQAEQRLGLEGQPRAIVFHEKDNRRHAHVVWSRIDTDAMKAVPMSFPKLKLNELAKDLYLEHAWELPKGFIDPKFRDPKNFTLAEWQQAKRTHQDPREMKAIFQSAWQQSDGRDTFVNALKEHGLILARGDRRGFVATDMHGEVYAIARWTGVKTKDVKARLGDRDALPSISQAQNQLGKMLTPNLQRLEQQQKEKQIRLGAQHQKSRNMLTQKHDAQRDLQIGTQLARMKVETKVRQERYNKGLRGLVDRITGTHGQIKRQNQFETYKSLQRDQKQRDDLIFRQMEQKRTLDRQNQLRLEKVRKMRSVLKSDIGRLNSRLKNPSRQRDGPER
jgi:MobA/VirD2-like, nuclease domain